MRSYGCWRRARGRGSSLAGRITSRNGSPGRSTPPAGGPASVGRAGDARAGSLTSVDVLVVDHPLAKTRLTAMRDERTDSSSFRAALHELTTMLVYEATRGVAVHTYDIQTPVAPTTGF